MSEWKASRLFRSSPVFIKTTCGLAIFSDIFFYGLLPPILPSILRERVHIRSDQVQLWTSLMFAIYSIAIVVSSPIAGHFSDAGKRRKPLFIGALLFQAAGIALLTVGTSLAWWISGVILAGLSSGVTWTSSLALAIDVTAKDKLAEGLAFISISLQCGLFAGTVLGGVVYQKGGYYAVWAMCYALIVVDVALRIVMLEAPRMQPAPATVECSTNDVGRTRLKPASTETARLVKSGRRLPPTLLLWRSPRFTATIVGTLLNATILTSFDGALTIHLEDVFGYTPLDVGLTFMALLVPIFMAPLVGRIADRHGARPLLTANLLLGTIPLVCLRYVSHNSIGQKVLVCALLFLVGLTCAGRLGIYTSQVNHAVRDFAQNRPGLLDPDRAIGQAQGVWNAAYSAGCGLGPVYSGLIQDRAGWSTETWTVALLGVCAAILAFLFTDGWIGKRTK
ncbi:unnamed protein product [Zymoseptoria tritici ST99CH_3D1]|uniref:Major facilitator superfamily (MFS) profile domain-containing protein n=1 Tax=Zymoseptoria tritici (strain ST99CH_3D7) TaxID=1276538 RepID=A0A1X7S798_ZYMT9|nr:unnamed protein product [Zymoseptoria tritici ST99CH_3D7]SMR63883.1 unnamed protein product [Zymoseptoria tritici ST99CH_3D1]